MTIYVDTLIFTNIIIDYLLLILTAKILKINFKYYRIVLAAICGGSTSIIILLPELNFIFNIVIRVIFALMIIFVAFGYKNIKTFLKRGFVLFLITTSFTGIILCFLTIIKSDFISVNNSIVYFNISPLLLIIFTTIAYLILKFIDKIKIDKTNLLHKIKFNFMENEFSFLSKYDTCCNIKEPFSGCEVILVEKDVLKGLYVPEDKIRIIPFNSLGGEGIIKGFLPKELYVDNTKIERKVYIGITQGIFNGEINSIFNYKNICE